VEVVRQRRPCGGGGGGIGGVGNYGRLLFSDRRAGEEVCVQGGLEGKVKEEGKEEGSNRHGGQGERRVRNVILD